MRMTVKQLEEENKKLAVRLEEVQNDLCRVREEHIRLKEKISSAIVVLQQGLHYFNCKGGPLS